MAPPGRGPFCVGSKSFDPDDLFEDDSVKIPGLRLLLKERNLRKAITSYFNIPDHDSYVYHAVASVNLAAVQRAIDQGAAHGLLDWYRDEGKPISPPPSEDINDYLVIFQPNYSAPNALNSFHFNARKSSLRSAVAAHLCSTRHLSPPLKPVKPIKPPRIHCNPAFEFWLWSCHALLWCGPHPSTAKLTASHHILPVMMHHFGCVVPSYEACELISQVAFLDDAPAMNKNDTMQKQKPEPKKKPRTILDIGSGNGYWTYILRRHHKTRPPHPAPEPLEVIAVDSGRSRYRTQWIPDTRQADGAAFIQSRGGGAQDDILLLVYPITGQNFTERVIRAYRGEWVIVVGTQCRNGYTAFKDCLIDEWMSTETDAEGKGWEKVAQVPMPSFPGKDEAMFIFRRVAKEALGDNAGDEGGDEGGGSDCGVVAD